MEHESSPTGLSPTSSAELVAAMAHDLRGVTAVVIQQLEVLNDSSVDAAVTKRSLATLWRGADELSRFVDDLTELEQLQRGGIEAQIRTVDLDEVISRAGAEHSWPTGPTSESAGRRAMAETDDRLVGRLIADLVGEANPDSRTEPTATRRELSLSTGPTGTRITIGPGSRADIGPTRPVTLTDGLHLVVAAELARLARAQLLAGPGGRSRHFVLAFPPVARTAPNRQGSATPTMPCDHGAAHRSTGADG